MMRALIALGFASALAGGVALAAEQTRKVGEYSIHWNALPSTFIEPDVAREWDITRSTSEALVNVTVTKPDERGLPMMEEATVSGTVRNLAGQEQTIAFEAKREGPAIYYLGSFRIAGEDTYRLALDVTVPGAARAERIIYTQALVGE